MATTKTDRNSQNSEDRTSPKQRTLVSYKEVLSDAEKLKDLKDRNIYRNTLRVLKDTNDFCTKYKISVQYRLAIPKAPNKDNVVNAGIEIGKVQMPQTLIQYLLTKANEDKPSKNRLLAMLLKHQKFNVRLVGNRIRILLIKVK